MNFHLERTTARHRDYMKLVELLDKEIQKRDGADFEFYNQFNSSEEISEVVLVYENEMAIGCGTIKNFNENTAEIKRMFTLPESRGKGIATLILDELTTWASEIGYQKLILETGKKYPEAISLYLKYGFRQTENYGQYVDMEESVCFEKSLI